MNFFKVCIIKTYNIRVKYYKNKFLSVKSIK